MFDFPPITSWQWLAISVFLIVAVFLIWKFRLEEVVQFPLPNEEDCGVWKVPLPRLGRGVQVGRVTTARNHYSAFLSRDITASKGDEQTKKLALREAALKKFIFAMRSGREKFIFICDANPMDPAMHVREPEKGSVPIRYVPVQDCESYGIGPDGFEYIALKLTKDVATFTLEQREENFTIAEALKYVQRSANNTEQIKSKDETIRMLTDLNQKYLATINTVMAQKGRSDLIAGTKDMLTGESQDMPPPTKVPSIKEFFTWAQVAAAAITFLVVPYLMRAAGIGPPFEPTTAAAVGAFLAWIATPFIRKLIGK